jgi:hypothetical protein
MANEPFNPETTTVEELAVYSRKVRRARWTGIVVGVLLIWPAFWAATHLLPDSLEWAAIIVLVLVPIAAFRLVFELLKPPGARIND